MRFTNRPYPLKEFLELITKERLRNLNGDDAIQGSIGIPLWNIIKDVGLGRFETKGSQVVLAPGTDHFKGIRFATIPKSGKVHLWGHGYRSGLQGVGVPVGRGALQKPTDQGYVNEEVADTASNLLELFNDYYFMHRTRYKTMQIQFYSCGSGGRIPGHHIFGESFIERFQREIKRAAYLEQNMRITVSGIAGAFTKRYAASELAPLRRLRQEIRDAYFSIYVTENKLEAVSTILRCPAQTMAVLEAYIKKLNDYERGCGRAPLSSEEKTILRRLFNNEDRTVAISMPHGFFLH